MKHKTIILIFIALILFFIAGGLYIDRQSKQKGINVGPSREIAGNAEFKNYGPAPDFQGISHWLNSSPLTMTGLKDKVVLVDFWTYSCINCIRTLSYVTSWYDTYKDKGLVVVGVHTPEFAFEKETSNVEVAIANFKIHYPVAQDNEYKTWDAYNNVYWPAEYLIDQNGQIRYEHFGEGNYDKTENAIRSLLGLSSMPSKVQGENVLEKVASPEMYFGTSRLQNLAPEEAPSSSPKAYSFPPSLALNNFALAGTWQFSGESAKLLSPTGKIRLKFSAGKLHFVAASPKGSTLTIVVDGKPQQEVLVKDSMLYTLFNSGDYSEHTVDIEIQGQGLEAFTFTFG